MRRSRFIALLFCLPLFLNAQTVLIPESDPDLLIQTDFDKLTELLLKGDIPMSYYGAFTGTTSTQTHRLELSRAKLSASLSLRERDGYGTSAAGLRLDALSPNLRTLSFGNYRANFGEGIVLGKASATTATEIEKPGSPLYYQPLGAAAQLSLAFWQLSAFISGQSRSCSLTDSLISYLPKTRSQKLTKTAESLEGICLGIKRKSFDLALLGYRQSYDRMFSSEDTERELKAISLAGALRLKRISLRGETANINGVQTLSLKGELIFPRLSQSISLAIVPQYQIPAYASRQTSLSTRSDATEYSYRIDYTPHPRSRVRFGTTVYQPYDDFDGRSLLGQIYGMASYRDTLNTASFAVTAFDRSIVSEIDAGYATTNPVHLRFESRYKHRIDSHLDWDILIRYHLEDKGGLQSDSWYWRSGLTLSYDKLSLTGGLRNWQSVYSFIEPENDAEPGDPDADQLIPAGEDELLLELSLSYSRKVFALSTKGSVSLLNGKPQFSLNVRVSPFKK